MSNYPEMTNLKAWTNWYLAKYRGKSKAYCTLVAILCMPACLIYWMALHGESAMQASTEYRPDADRGGHQ